VCQCDCARYWFHKNLDKDCLPVGLVFRRVISDIVHKWPGRGLQGLQLLQVGVSLPTEDIMELHVHVDTVNLTTDDVSPHNIRSHNKHVYIASLYVSLQMCIDEHLPTKWSLATEFVAFVPQQQRQQ